MIKNVNNLNKDREFRKKDPNKCLLKVAFIWAITLKLLKIFCIAKNFLTYPMRYFLKFRSLAYFSKSSLFKDFFKVTFYRVLVQNGCRVCASHRGTLFHTSKISQRGKNSFSERVTKIKSFPLKGSRFPEISTKIW